MATETLRTVCNRDCPDACGLIATVEDGKLVALGGDPEHPVTKGFLCQRTSQYPATQNSPDRLTTPLLRKNGRLSPASWDEALGFVADRLLAIRKESGPAAILHYRSGGSLGLLKSVVDYFWELFGPVTVKSGDICSGAGDAAQTTDFGEEESHDFFDLLNAKNILLWGKNPAVSNVHLMPVLQQAKRNGARVILVDPIRHKAAKLADRTILVRPGGDFDLAMGVAARLFETGGVVPDAEGFCGDFEAFRALAGGALRRGLGERGRRRHRGRRRDRLGARRAAVLHPGGLGHGPADERLGDRPRARRARRGQRQPRHSRRRRVLLLQAARAVRHVVPEEDAAARDSRAPPRGRNPRGRGSRRSARSG